MEDREEYESQRLASEIRCSDFNPAKFAADNDESIASQSEDSLLNSNGWETITLPNGNTYTYNKKFWDKFIFESPGDLTGTVGDNNLTSNK